MAAKFNSIGILTALSGAALAINVRAKKRRQRSRVLRGSTVFITGGSRGLGLALAEEFLRWGSRVAIAARDEEELTRAKAHLHRRFETRDHDVVATVCDVRNPVDVDRAISAATRAFGPIKILINNAGVINVAPFENQTLENFHTALDTNFYGALHVIRAVLPQMAERRTGTIVNIASIGGIVAVPHLLPYTASKFALVGFSRGLNAELRPLGIRVVTVCPWLMKTGSHLHAVFGGQRDLEYGWFSLGATLPLISVPARSAARRIVEAITTGRHELLISNWAAIANAAVRFVPGLTRGTLALANRCLPKMSLGGGQAQGKDIPGAVAKLTSSLGESAAIEFNQ